MRILILGCGPLTSLLLASPGSAEHQFTVLSDDMDCLNEVADEPRVTPMLILEPLMQDYLQLGGIDNADAFMALSEDEHQNILTCQIAKHIFNVGKVVCRLENTQLQKLYSELDLEVVSPTLDLLQDLNQVLQS
jgi:trk system potassium uptake protein TrkA